MRTLRAQLLKLAAVPFARGTLGRMSTPATLVHTTPGTRTVPEMWGKVREYESLLNGPLRHEGAYSSAVREANRGADAAVNRARAARWHSEMARQGMKYEAASRTAVYKASLHQPMLRRLVEGTLR